MTLSVAVDPQACAGLINSLLGDEATSFEALDAQCQHQDPRTLLYSLARPEGCVEAASCAQMGVTTSEDRDMYYNGKGRWPLFHPAPSNRKPVGVLCNNALHQHKMARITSGCVTTRCINTKWP